MLAKMRIYAIPSNRTPIQPLARVPRAARPSRRKRTSNRREHISLFLPTLVREGQSMESLLASGEMREARQTDVTSIACPVGALTRCIIAQGDDHDLLDEDLYLERESPLTLDVMLVVLTGPTPSRANSRNVPCADLMTSKYPRGPTRCIIAQGDDHDLLDEDLYLERESPLTLDVRLPRLAHLSANATCQGTDRTCNARCTYWSYALKGQLTQRFSMDRRRPAS
jgi:hypothetical protein